MIDTKFPGLPSYYEVLTLLGEGAFSRVYKGTNIQKGEDVAIKVINKKNLGDRQLFNIKNEIQIMNSLNNANSHPNILKLIETFDSADNTYLVIEFCDGGEIFDKIIEYTYLSEDLTRHIFLQLLDAVFFMHQNNIVHRDIKPENLLYKSIPVVERLSCDFHASLRSSDEDTKVDEGIFRPGIGGGGIGMIKLADFGLAKQLKYDTTTSFGLTRSNLKTPCGTAGYTAPEVIHCGVERKRRFRSSHSRSNFYSKSVDIWSLGCFLYTSLCGFPPFYDDDSEVLTQKILTGDFVFLSPWWDEVTPDAKNLISRMLVVNVKSRITIEEIYNHPWMLNSVSMKQESYFPEQNLIKTLREPSGSAKPSNRIKSPAAMMGGLASPKIAIKQVFDNPAMSYMSSKLLGKANREWLLNSEGFKEVKFDTHARGDSRCTSMLPRTPNPIDKVNFGDVLTRACEVRALSQTVNHLESDDDYDDSEDDNLEGFSDSETASWDGSYYDGPRTREILEFEDESCAPRFRLQEESPVVKGIRHLSLSSTTSLESLSLSVEEYVTRSSSVMSGANGEVEFTLTLNDLNLLKRRTSTKSGRT